VRQPGGRAVLYYEISYLGKSIYSINMQKFLSGYYLD
jgi:hypothetical protein